MRPAFLAAILLAMSQNAPAPAPQAQFSIIAGPVDADVCRNNYV